MNICGYNIPNEIVWDIVQKVDNASSLRVCTVFHDIFFPALVKSCQQSFLLKDRMAKITKDSDKEKIRGIHWDLMQDILQIDKDLKKGAKLIINQALSLRKLEALENWLEDARLADHLDKFKLAALTIPEKETRDVAQLFLQDAAEQSLVQKQAEKICEWVDFNEYQVKQVQRLCLSGFHQSYTPALDQNQNLIMNLKLTPHVKFTRMPSIVFQFENLKSLCLQTNQLTNLPKSIERLSQLQILKIGSNNLKNLPESIGKLTNLQVLFFEHNHLENLPESIGQLTKLERFNCSHNQLSSLPEWIGQLKNMKKIALIKNPLTTLPQSMKQLTKLEEIYLNGTNITILGASAIIGHIDKLKLDFGTEDPEFK